MAEICEAYGKKLEGLFISAVQSPRAVSQLASV
jgi:hypothetical protein